MNQKRIYFSPPLILEEDIVSIANTLRGGWVATVGPELDAFEARLRENFGFGHVLALNSGTSALHLAVKLSDIRRGDRVLIGTFTFVAVANAVLYEGGVPVFIDSDARSWNLDPDLLEAYFSDQRRKGALLPRAVIATHIFGFPAFIERIRSICREYEVLLIEDAAEALGSQVNGQCAGSFGHFGVLSFNGNKIITAGGGGALICPAEREYELARKWSTQSKEKATYYLHREMGYNYRLTNVLAGLGISQLGRFDSLVSGRKEIYTRYREMLEPLDWVTFKEPIEGQVPNHWISPVLIKKEFLHEVDPDRLLTAFEAADIEARRFWRPLHLQPLFKDAEYVGGGVAEDLFDRGICLPSGNGLSFEDLERIVKVCRGQWAL